MKINRIAKWNPKKFLRNFLHLLIALLVFIFMFDLLEQEKWNDYVIPHYRQTNGYKEESWILRCGDEILDPQTTLPSFRRLEKGKHYTLSARLTYDSSQDPVPFAFFYVHHMFCKAYLDGEELFSYTPENVVKLDASSSPGNIYVSVPMPDDSRGKEFTIEFVPPLSGSIDYELPYPVFGDYPSMAFSTFKKDLPHNAIALVSLFMGICSVLFSSLVLSGSEYREGLFIGIFAILFSIYNITECTFNFYLISNPYYTYLLNYATFSTLPIFMMAFLRERLDPGLRKFAAAMIVIATLLFGTELVLHFTGAMDMRQFLPILHIAYFSELVIVLILLAVTKRKLTKKHLILQMLPIMIGMTIDLAIYYEHWQLSSSDAAFTTIGVLIFLIFELYHVWQRSIEIYTASIRSQEYQAMAYIDALTGIGNRRAFEAEMEKIRGGEIHYRRLFVVSADVNNLKTANDTLGHAAGDFLIRNAASVLTELTADCGISFRTGGDEFVAFLYNIDQEEFEHRLAAGREMICKLNSTSSVKLSLALGYESITGGDIDSAFQSADQKMYIRKNKMKAEQASAADQN